MFSLGQCPSATYVHPTGNEQSLHNCINALRGCYGDKQGKHYRVWVDQVLPTQIDSKTWLVKFDMWVLSGGSLSLIILFVQLNMFFYFIHLDDVLVLTFNEITILQFWLLWVLVEKLKKYW